MDLLNSIQSFFRRADKDFATGTRAIDDVYQEFMDKLNAAGMQEMIADAQSQLDAYLAR